MLRPLTEGKLESEQVAQSLESHHQRLQASLDHYEESYIFPSDWTLEVALADQLWLQGLDQLPASLGNENVQNLDGGLVLCVGSYPASS
jgi:hypothetical protein